MVKAFLTVVHIYIVIIASYQEVAKTKTCHYVCTKKLPVVLSIPIHHYAATTYVMYDIQNMNIYHDVHDGDMI